MAGLLRISLSTPVCVAQTRYVLWQTGGSAGARIGYAVRCTVAAIVGKTAPPHGTAETMSFTRNPRIAIDDADGRPRGTLARTTLTAEGGINAGIFNNRHYTADMRSSTITAERATHTPNIVSINIVTPQVTVSIAMTVGDAELFATILGVVTDGVNDAQR